MLSDGGGGGGGGGLLRSTAESASGEQDGWSGSTAVMLLLQGRHKHNKHGESGAKTLPRAGVPEAGAIEGDEGDDDGDNDSDSDDGLPSPLRQAKQVWY